MMQFTITGPGDIDPSRLAGLRVEAMKPSLEAVGRFDPDRARRRFLGTYAPSDTHLVWSAEDLIGFYVLRRAADHLYLDHLYVRPARQGGGVGRHVLRAIQDNARDAGLPIRLMALRGSPANAFYTLYGFVLTGTDDLDNFYVWTPDQ